MKKITKKYKYSLLVFSERYTYIDKKMHKEDGPAYIEYYRNKRIKKEIYYKNNRIHRENGPAVIHYYKNGNIKSYVYYLDNKIHRTYGPAMIEYTANGDLFSLNWVHKNKFYFYEVKKWLKEKNFDKWQEMKEDDYDRMWMEIL